MFNPVYKKIIIWILGLLIAATALALFYASNPSTRPETLTDPYNLTQSEKNEFYKDIASNAAPSAFIDLSACNPKPSAIKIPQNQLLTVQNKDAVFHFLTIGPLHEYLIPAGESREITADFGQGPGVYGYGCDENEDIAGFIVVTE